MPKGNPNAQPPKAKSRRKAFRDTSKPYCKDRHDSSALRRKARLERTIERAQLELAEVDSDSEYEDVDTATEGEKRTVIKFYWQTLGKPKRPSTWGGINGVISYIRRKIGSTAPSIAACQNTLERLAADEDCDVSQRRAPSKERKREFSHEEDMYVGLLICEGHSQRSALRLVNGDRIAAGKEPITRQVIRDAEKRVEIHRQKRRHEKSGSADLESAWSLASLAFALQVQGQLHAGAALAARPTVGPVIKLERKLLQCAPEDVWGLLGNTVPIRGSHFLGVTKAQKKATYPCVLEGYLEYKWSATDIAPTYICWSTRENTRYPIKATDIFSYLTGKQRADITAALEARAAAPPPFVPEQLLVIDQHHRKCRLGLSSKFDCRMPMKDGKWCAADDGGVYDDHMARKTSKFPKEVRFHFGVLMREVDGKMYGDRIEPFEYTGKWVVGVKRIATEVKAIVDRANRLKGGGEWSITQGYTQEDLAGLEGGRREAWFIEKYGSGEGWYEAVLEQVGKGGHPLMCVTELMQHTINEGNRKFEGTKFADTWMINSDRLSSWWEVEAQNYLRERGFFDRQVRAWGDTNKDYWRYHKSVVGDRPELCALDFHLFWDLENALYENMVRTACLPVGDDRRYDDGTPAQLASAIKRTWQQHPLSERIVEDISRYPIVIDRIVECKGGVVEDHTVQREGCSRSKRRETKEAAKVQSRVYRPDAEVEAVSSARCAELRSTAKRLVGD